MRGTGRSQPAPQARGAGRKRQSTTPSSGAKALQTRAVSRSTASATPPSATAAIPPSPIARPIESPDAIPTCRGQVHLAQHHREPERADDADADDHQRDGADEPADEHEDEDHRRQQRLGDEQRPPEPEPVGDRAEQQRSHRAGEQHQRQQAVAVGLRVAERHDPERHEGEQPEPGDAAKPDHAAEDDHRPHVVLPGRAPAPAALGSGRSRERYGSAASTANEPRTTGIDGEQPSRAEAEPEHERRDDDRPERVPRVAADVEERHPARPLAPAREHRELRSLGMEGRDAEAGEEDEHDAGGRSSARSRRGRCPTPASASPAGSSQSAPRRSDQSPKSGCVRDDETSTASIRTAVSV